MLLSLSEPTGLLAQGGFLSWLTSAALLLKVLIGFSIIIFFHELGHFLAAKWVGIRVDRFAVGFGPRLLGYRRGEGLTFGSRPNYRSEDLQRRGYGETDYCLRAFPIGGYVKMLGQDDVIIDEESGEIRMTDDPRAFTSKPVGQRMIVVSAGVVFNLLFAALLLMAVFLHGREVQAPLVGMVPPESPAAGVLLPGDRILEVNGEHVSSLRDVLVAGAIAGIAGHDDVALTVQRGEQRLENIVVPLMRDERTGLARLEIVPFQDSVLVADGEPVDDLPVPRKGDRITHADGQPVETFFDVVRVFRLSHGRIVRLTVERSDPNHPDAPPKVVECYQRPTLMLLPAQEPTAGTDRRRGGDTAHLLGLSPRRRVLQVIAGMPAQRAGFQPGDVIAEWGTVPNPMYGEILDSIESHAGQPVRVVVLRGGERVTLHVTPERPFSLWSRKPAHVGLVFGLEREPVVADVTADTPAAELGLPRGARIVAVDGRKVGSWSEVVEAFFGAAGRAVAVRYRSGGIEVEGTMRIPSSIVNELDLPPTARVQSVDGREAVERVDPATGKTIRQQISDNPWALRRALRECVGRTVDIRFRRSLDSPLETASFTVRADNIDPWQMRVLYIPQALSPAVHTEVIDAGGNPLAALVMGLREGRSWMLQIYGLLRGLVAQRTAGVEHVSGPVGIVGAAVEKARAGWVELCYFLAFLSVNLAVINFLPVPVMDGGLMVFLLIEKIKGRPLSLKTQMISTLVGLAALILIGLFVTFQDIGRLFNP